MAEMTRSEFLKSCTLGACSCSLVALSATETAMAESGNSEVDTLKAQRDAIRIRYAKLLASWTKRSTNPPESASLNAWDASVPTSSARSRTTSTKMTFAVFSLRFRHRADGWKKPNTTRRPGPSESSTDSRVAPVRWWKKG